jgi:hypothetical protein
MGSQRKGLASVEHAVVVVQSREACFDALLAAWGAALPQSSATQYPSRVFRAGELQDERAPEIPRFAARRSGRSTA